MAPAKACKIWHLVSIKDVWRTCNLVYIEQRISQGIIIFKLWGLMVTSGWKKWILSCGLVQCVRQESKPGRLWVHESWSLYDHSVSPGHNPKLLICLSGRQGCPLSVLGLQVSTQKFHQAGLYWASHPLRHVSLDFLMSAERFWISQTEFQTSKICT